MTEAQEHSRIEVRVIGVPGCKNTEKTLALVKQEVEVLGVRAEIAQITVNSPAAVERERMLGSPTVQINGRDIDPALRSSKAFTYS